MVADSEMRLMGQKRSGMVSVFSRAAIVLAICSLTFSLATRYVDLSSGSQIVKAINVHAPQAKRQHLLGDGAHWTAPVSSFRFLERMPCVVRAVSADVL